MKTINVNWSNQEFDGTWEYIGASLMRDKEQERLEQCTHGNENQDSCEDCECYPDQAADDNYPMMNYAYPLHSLPDDDKIIEVCEKTSCTVVYNNDEDIYYLALTGGGMDLSQSIALAYIIADGCIDWDMLEDVYISQNLCLSKEEYKLVLSELERQLNISIDRQKRKLEEVQEQLVNLNK